MLVQTTLTLLTGPLEMVPLPFVIAQFWAGEEGGVATVTA